MRIFIVRHGIAVERGTKEYAENNRPLTEEGIKKLKKSAKGFLNLLSTPDEIVSSPYLRAFQTAEILASVLKFRKKITVSELLTPDHAPSGMAEFLAKRPRTESVVLVGHEPHLSKLVAHLLGVKSHFLQLKKGGACCIEVALEAPGELLWHVTPKILRNLKSRES